MNSIGCGISRFIGITLTGVALGFGYTIGKNWANNVIESYNAKEDSKKNK